MDTIVLSPLGLTTILGFTSVFSMFIGAYASTFLYDQFEKKLHIIVVPQEITDIKKLPTGAIPVYSKGKLLFYTMEVRDLGGG